MPCLISLYPSFLLPTAAQPLTDNPTMVNTMRSRCLLLAVSLLVAYAAAAPQNATTASMVESLSLDELDEQLQVKTLPLAPLPSTSTCFGMHQSRLADDATSRRAPSSKSSTPPNTPITPPSPPR